MGYAAVMDEIYEQGKCAAQAGRPLSDNPYVGRYTSETWICGHFDYFDKRDEAALRKLQRLGQEYDLAPNQTEKD